MEYGLFPGRYPAVVRAYDADRRTCRIEIPGITDGWDVLPEADIEYPIGEKSSHDALATEIEMLRDDPVWIAFVGGDPRYPLITGYRNPKTGNAVDWRRWHHANIELLADQLMRAISGGDMLLESGTHVVVRAPRVTIDSAETTCTGKLTVQGDAVFSGGSVSHGGKEIGKGHSHKAVQPGSGNSGEVN